MLLEAVKDLLFPVSCLECGVGLPDSRAPHLCSTCASDVVFAATPRCHCCGLPFVAGGDHLCGDCLRESFAFDLARYAVLYQPPVISLLLGLKFAGKMHGLETLAALVNRSGALKELSEPDLVIPVPLHLNRLRERGYNQAQLLAKFCFPQWRERLDVDSLRRHQPTTPQSTLSGKERRRNLKRAFSVKASGKLQGKAVLLIDDVFTTGTTVNECTNVLVSAGAVRVQVFTVSRSV